MEANSKNLDVQRDPIAGCPSCGAPVRVIRLRCTNPACRLEVSGPDVPVPLAGLSAEEVRFVVDFVRASGSLKAVANQYSISYPTLRTRLNALILKLGVEQPSPATAPVPDPHELAVEVVSMVRRGDVSPLAGERLMELLEIPPAR